MVIVSVIPFCGVPFLSPAKRLTGPNLSSQKKRGKLCQISHPPHPPHPTGPKLLAPTAVATRQPSSLWRISAPHSPQRQASMDTHMSWRLKGYRLTKDVSYKELNK